MRQAASPRKQHALELFSGLPDRYDRMGAVLSFGQDPRWRCALVASVEASPDDRVLDVATGTGLVAEAVVRRYGCSVVGLDQSEAMLAGARHRVAARPALGRRVELVHAEAEELPFEDASFDAVTFTYLLRYVDDPAATMRELARVLKPGGRMASLEFGVPARRRCRLCGRLTRGSGFPRSDAWSRASGTTLAASSDQASRPSTSATRTLPFGACGRTPAYPFRGCVA